MSLGRIIGNAWCYEDNINTDLIYPGKYLTTSDPVEMAKHAMAGVDPEFGRTVSHGDVIVAGENFGNGSSREQAAISLKYAGISAVIAVSFARIFYRNIINQGVPAITSPKAYKIIQYGDELELEVHEGILKNLTNMKTITFEPLPEFLLEIIEAGGYIPYLKEKLTIRGSEINSENE